MRERCATGLSNSGVGIRSVPRPCNDFGQTAAQGLVHVERYAGDHDLVLESSGPDVAIDIKNPDAWKSPVHREVFQHDFHVFPFVEGDHLLEPAVLKSVLVDGGDVLFRGYDL